MKWRKPVWIHMYTQYEQRFPMSLYKKFQVYTGPLYTPLFLDTDYPEMAL